MKLPPDINLLDDLPQVDGFYSLQFRNMSSVILHAYMATNGAARLKDFNAAVAVLQAVSPKAHSRTD